MKKTFLSFFLVLVVILAKAQQGVAISTDASQPHNSAMLDIKSNNKGLLPPRLSWQQIQTISNPAAGLIAYDIGINVLRMYNGTKWVILSEKANELADAPGGYSQTTQTGNDIIYTSAIEMGADKSIYVTGVFTGSAMLGGWSLNNPDAGNIFLAKFDSLGTVVWAKTIGGNGYESGTGVTVDASGSIYICGFFNSTVDLDPSPATYNLTSYGGYDGFYAKYDNNGNILWGKKIGGMQDDYARAITTDGISVYLTGEFRVQANFNIVLLTSSGIDDIFIARYQCSTGNMGVDGWVKKMGGDVSDAGLSIKMFASNIIVGGYFGSISDFAGTIKTSYGQFDGFVSVHQSTGSLLSIYQLGGPGNDQVTTVAANLFNASIYCGGTFNNTADFDSRPGIVLNRTSQGGADAFIARYTSGNPVWVTTFGEAQHEELKAIDVDNSGDLYAIGTFANTVSFGGLPLSSLGGSQLFLLKADEITGFISWAQQAGGLSTDNGEDVAVSNNGKLLFAAGTIHSNPSFGFNRTRIFNKGLYLARYEE